MKLTEITIPNLTEAQHEALDGRLRDRKAPEYRVLGRYKGTDNVNGPYHLGETFRLYRARSFLLEQGIPFSAEYTRTYRGGRDVDSHLWRICHEARLEVMVQVFEIILDRGERDEASILALTAEDVTNWYNVQVGPAIDRIEADLQASEDVRGHP